MTTPEDLLKRGTLDFILDSDDILQFEVQQRNNKQVVYVHINGVTVLRVMADTIEYS